MISVNVDSVVPEAQTASSGARVFDEFDTNVEALGLIMVHQYNLKKGLELFGDKAEVDNVIELQQIHDMGTYVPLEAAGLTPEQKAKALSSLMFIVEKRDGRVKAMGANNGLSKVTARLSGRRLLSAPIVSSSHLP